MQRQYVWYNAYANYLYTSNVKSNWFSSRKYPTVCFYIGEL